MVNKPRMDTVVTTPTTGLDVHVRDWGGDGPSLLFIHGLTSSCRIFDLCAPLLTDICHVVTYDQRGHGATAQPNDGYDLATLADDGRGLVDALGLAQPFILAGHSWGAFVALAWAARYPTEIAALTLIDGAAYNYRDIPTMTQEGFETRFARLDETLASSNTTFDDVVAEAHTGPFVRVDPDAIRALTGSRIRIAPDGSLRARLLPENRLQILRALWATDITPLYRALRCPTLALLADPPPDDADRDLAKLARVSTGRLQAVQSLLQVQWLPDTVHDAPLQRPDAVAHTLTEFIDALPR